MDTHPRALVVVSAADRTSLRNGRSESTGTYLGELIEPTDAMLDAGFRLSFATPGARIPTIDGTSCSLMYVGLSRSKRTKHSPATPGCWTGLATPAKLEEIAHDQRRLANMPRWVDLLHRDAFTDDSLNDDFGALMLCFHNTQRPTCLICHAPAALAAASGIESSWIYDNYSDLTAGPSATASAERVLDLFAGILHIRLELLTRTAVLEIAVTGDPANGFLGSTAQLLELVSNLVGCTHGESSSVRHRVPAEEVGLHRCMLTGRDEDAAHHRVGRALSHTLSSPVATHSAQAAS